MSVAPQNLGWLGISRLGLVQAALGAVVVLATSTLNRVMVVEWALPALLPGILVAVHYLVQVLRPRMGFGSDLGARRTPWIVGGMGVLATGGLVSAVATALMGAFPVPGIALALVGFVLIGVGVSASGTSLLVLLAKRVAEHRRAAAATTVWVMMIAGFAITAGVAGQLLDPFSPARLVAVAAGVSGLAMVVTVLALYGVEGYPERPAASTESSAPPPAFRDALRQVWAEPVARQFTIFVFISMLAYSSQDLILEPFAGEVFGYTPGESTKLSGLQHGGVLAGMLLMAAAGSLFSGSRWGSLRHWAVYGCVASALALLGLAAAGLMGPQWPFKATVFVLGVSNGAFSIAAIGSMMRLAGEGRASREGVRMGMWGAAQAVAFGLGGLIGTGASDLARWALGSPSAAYTAVFAFEAALFLGAAILAARLGQVAPARPAASPSPVNVAALQQRSFP
ncbi:MAG: BCD family MFS transporter [Pseudomonadota bacterium]